MAAPIAVNIGSLVPSVNGAQSSREGRFWLFLKRNYRMMMIAIVFFAVVVYFEESFKQYVKFKEDLESWQQCLQDKKIRNSKRCQMILNGSNFDTRGFIAMQPWLWIFDGPTCNSIATSTWYRLTHYVALGSGFISVVLVSDSHYPETEHEVSMPQAKGLIHGTESSESETSKVRLSGDKVLPRAHEVQESTAQLAEEVGKRVKGNYGLDEEREHRDIDTGLMIKIEEEKKKSPRRSERRGAKEKPQRNVLNGILGRRNSKKG
ncbi:hypothetical protein TWF718_000364 [Orbilia javanica]|uniref:Uncharacterized protein n=1 Tax=Orbilia javanica TaxID=47235 RepID=A0AAN8P120_9PEZI